MPELNDCRICSGALELVCGGNGSKPIPDDFAPAAHERGRHGDFYRCLECGTVQQPSLPAATELHELYRQMRDPSYMLEEEGRREAARRLLGRLAPHVPAGRLLDVGCGHGLLLDEARSRGYDVVGVELSAAGVRHALDVLGLPVLQATLEDAGFLRESFDAIVLTDVLEHLDDPVATLSLCAELLAPGGAMLVTTPDPSSVTARVIGRRWWSYVLAHRFLVPAPTMRELLAAQGLVLAAEHPYVRVFSLSYWLEGLAGRGASLKWLTTVASRAGSSRRLVAAAMHDERTYIARRIEVLAPARHRARDRGGELKVHAVIPAHNAGRTIERVAAALPVAAIDRALVVDDASTDSTTTVALAAGLEVLAHPTTRGYGANQKTCYVASALAGADIVVMVHGDDQYDPAMIAEMTRPIEEGRADVVIGSRLLEDKAIIGGMPRWKWIGNRALTAVENAGFRRRYSEYHTGYRAFSLAFLRSVPFLRNSDDFVFDQEMFAQIVATDARVVELAIPTRYFLEASTVSFRASVIYGCKTLAVLIRFRLDERHARWPLLRRPATALAPRPAEQVESLPPVSVRGEP